MQARDRVYKSVDIYVKVRSQQGTSEMGNVSWGPIEEALMPPKELQFQTRRQIPEEAKCSVTQRQRLRHPVSHTSLQDLTLMSCYHIFMIPHLKKKGWKKKRLSAALKIPGRVPTLNTKILGPRVGPMTD